MVKFHMGIHKLGCWIFLSTQKYPASFWQVEEHPSPLTVFPSSHYKSITIPSPHKSTHFSNDSLKVKFDLHLQLLFTLKNSKLFG